MGQTDFKPYPEYSYAERLYLANLLRQPAIRAAVEALSLPPGSRGLDAGCGIGLVSVLLAEAVGPEGHVTGLDISLENLAHAEEMARTSGLGGRLTYQEGDIASLPFDDGTFDWAWSADTIWPGPKEMGCPTEDPAPLVAELVRVVKPGGMVALAFWSSQRLLPGHPQLEARLNATEQSNVPFQDGMPPRLHVLNALGWLRDARLVETRARAFAASVHAPLDRQMRVALTMTFYMFWSELESEVSREDWAEFQRLCQPDSPDWILNRPDYHAIVTYSLFRGRVAM